jgi:BON domain
MAVGRKRAEPSHVWPRIVGVVGAACAATAAGAMYLFDPRLGKTRRTQLRARLGSVGRTVTRRTGRRVGRQTRYLASTAAGKKEKILRGEDAPPENDETLSQKIQSEVLGGTRYPKGKVNVSVQRGVAVLVGELPSEDLIASLEQEVRKVTGVVDVHNLLHLPGQPAPQKDEGGSAR